MASLLSASTAACDISPRTAPLRTSGLCRFLLVGLLPTVNIRHQTRLRTCRHSGELLFDDWDYSSPQEFNRPQHLLMRERRHAHLKRNASEAAKGFVHVEYF